MILAIKLSFWLLAIFAITACMVTCAGIAIGYRTKRNRRTARIAFILFIVFLLADCVAMIIFANKTVNKVEGYVQEVVK